MSVRVMWIIHYGLCVTMPIFNRITSLNWCRHCECERDQLWRNPSHKGRCSGQKLRGKTPDAQCWPSLERRPAFGLDSWIAGCQLVIRLIHVSCKMSAVCTLRLQGFGCLSLAQQWYPVHLDDKEHCQQRSKRSVHIRDMYIGRCTSKKWHQGHGPKVLAGIMDLHLSLFQQHPALESKDRCICCT